MRIKESNMEHYRNEILDITKNTRTDFAIDKEDGPLVNCKDIICSDCVFREQMLCGKNKTLWLMEDYKEPITLTAREKHFVEFVEIGWIARDEDGEVLWYLQKPIKDKCGWRCGCDYLIISMVLDDCFSFVTWEDEEPWSVEELRKLKVKE